MLPRGRGRRGEGVGARLTRRLLLADEEAEDRFGETRLKRLILDCRSPTADDVEEELGEGFFFGLGMIMLVPKKKATGKQNGGTVVSIVALILVPV